MRYGWPATAASTRPNWFWPDLCRAAVSATAWHRLPNVLETLLAVAVIAIAVAVAALAGWAVVRLARPPG